MLFNSNTKDLLNIKHILMFNRNYYKLATLSRDNKPHAHVAYRSPLCPSHDFLFTSLFTFVPGFSPVSSIVVLLFISCRARTCAFHCVSPVLTAAQCCQPHHKKYSKWSAVNVFVRELAARRCLKVSNLWPIPNKSRKTTNKKTCLPIGFTGCFCTALPSVCLSRL